jgi:hypothetical protein
VFSACRMLALPGRGRMIDPGRRDEASCLTPSFVIQFWPYLERNQEQQRNRRCTGGGRKVTSNISTLEGKQLPLQRVTRGFLG